MLTDIESFSTLNTFLQTSNVVIFVIVIKLDYLSFYFSEENEDGVVDGCQDDEDGD